MDIICDTHIWYLIGDNSIDLTVLDPNDKLIANYNNIDELSRTQNLLSLPDYTIKAIQSVCKHSSNHAIIDAPFIYLKKLSNPDFKYDMSYDIYPMIEFFNRIANGDTIIPEKEEEFKQMSEARKADLKAAAEAMNNEAARIKKALGKKELLTREERIPHVRELISYYVSLQSEDDGLSKDFDWTQIELFENVMLDVYMKMEKGALTLKPNDWYDMFLLAYVKPENKVWTREVKWKNLIIDSGMEKYLYEK